MSEPPRGAGMTESACTICMTRPGDVSTGHVGSPVPCCEVKLADIPEMKYMHDDRPHPRGEVCVRGPIVFQVRSTRLPLSHMHGVRTPMQVYQAGGSVSSAPCGQATPWRAEAG